MTLPTSQPVPPSDPTSLSAARRRRQRRHLIPESSDEHAAFLDELSLQVSPPADFFLSALLCAVALAFALAFDAPALLVLAALLAPFMGPVLGMGLASVAGSITYFFRSLGALLLGGLMVFLGGLVAGWLGAAPEISFFSPIYALGAFHWTNILLLTIGAVLSTYQVLRSQQAKNLVASVAIAYEVFLPLGVAGLGLATQNALLWPMALVVFVFHLLWAVLVVIVTLAVLGLRPLNSRGYALVGTIAVVTLGLFFIGRVTSVDMLPPPAQTPTQQETSVGAQAQTPEPLTTLTTAPAGAVSSPVVPTPGTPVPATVTKAGATNPPPTLTLPMAPTSSTITATHTLVPSRTPTLTITPQPTPIWAKVSSPEGGGLVVREEPRYDANIIKSLLNGSLVQVLPDLSRTDNIIWVKVRTVDGKEGWVVRSLLATATPAPAGN